MTCKFFLPFSALFFIFLIMSLNILHFEEVQFIYFILFLYFCVIFKKPIIKSKVAKIVSMFSFKSFIVLIFIFQSLIHFKLIFVCDVRQGHTIFLVSFFTFVAIHESVLSFWMWPWLLGSCGIYLLVLISLSAYSLRFFTLKIMLLQIGPILFFPFQSVYLLFPFIVLVHPSLVPDLRGRNSVFHLYVWCYL